MPVGHNVSTAHQLFGWVCLLLDVSVAIYLVVGLVRRERAGRILLDLGRIDENPAKRIVFGAFFLILGFAGLVFFTHDPWSYYIFVILQGVNLIVMGLQRFLICESGILSTGRRQQFKLFAWDDILSYSLERGKLRLKLRDKCPLGHLWIVRRVRLDYQDELHTLLVSRCPRLESPVGI